MRKGLTNTQAKSRLESVIKLSSAAATLLAISIFSLLGANSAHAEGANEWASAVFSKPTNAAAIGSATSGGKKARSSGSTKLASLGGGAPSKPSTPVTGGGVTWVASSGCLNGTLRSAVQSIASRFGPVTVSSTCRSAGRNRAVGGAPKSHHLTGDAVDFRVHGNYGGVYAALSSMGLGGIKHYGGGLFHADTGPRRTW